MEIFEAGFYFVIIVVLLVLMIFPFGSKQLPKHQSTKPPTSPGAQAANPNAAKGIYLNAHEQQIVKAALGTYERKQHDKIKNAERKQLADVAEHAKARIDNIKVLRFKFDNWYNDAKPNSKA